jgi:hypothetical protein
MDFYASQPCEATAWPLCWQGYTKSRKWTSENTTFEELLA